MMMCVSQASPHVNHFQFSEEQTSVRLVVASPDDICATIAVHPYTVSYNYFIHFYLIYLPT